MKYIIISIISMLITTHVVAVVPEGPEKEPNPFQWLSDQRAKDKAAREKLGPKFDYPRAHQLWKNSHRSGYMSELYYLVNPKGKPWRQLSVAETDQEIKKLQDLASATYGFSYAKPPKPVVVEESDEVDEETDSE